MTASSSAEKQRRESIKRHLRNKAAESRVKTVVTRARKAISTVDGDAKEAVVAAISALDKAAEKGVIHKNAAARRKSRLVLKVNALAKPTTGKKPAARKKKA